jgi:hypothetical protein
VILRLLFLILWVTLLAPELATANPCQNLMGLSGAPSVERITDPILELREKSEALLKKLNQYATVYPTPQRIRNDGTVPHYMAAKVEVLLRTAEAIFNPVPFFKRRHQKIFDKLAGDPNYLPTDSESKELEKFNLQEAYERRARFTRDHPIWTGFRRGVAKTVSAIVLASTLIAANHTLQVTAETFRPADYVKIAGSRSAAGEVDILVDLSVLPHLAVQIDGKVYSYGQANNSTPTVGQYFGALKEANAPTNVQVVRLNLSLAEKSRLKRELELSAFKEYLNITGINDCASMIAQALKRNTDVEIPRFISASPSQFVMYLSLLKSLNLKNTEGLPLVAKEFQVSAAPFSGAKALQTARGIYMNQIESNFLISNAAFFVGGRILLDATHAEKDLQWISPEAKTLLDQWQAQSREQVLSDPQIKFIVSKMEELRNGPRGSDRDRSIAALRRYSQIHIGARIAQIENQVESPDIDVIEILKSDARLQALKEIRSQIQTF